MAFQATELAHLVPSKGGIETRTFISVDFFCNFPYCHLSLDIDIVPLDPLNISDQ